MRIPFHTTLAIASLSFLLSACSESFTDWRDGQSYDVVKIGDLTWMAENLNYETETSACPDGDTRNCKRLGRLYTWAEAKTICPEGWRLPTKADFAQLLAQPDAGAPGAVSNKVGAALKSRDGWFKKETAPMNLDSTRSRRAIAALSRKRMTVQLLVASSMASAVTRISGVQPKILRIQNRMHSIYSCRSAVMRRV